MGDPLFTVLNNFHCGAYQLAINAAQELEDLPASAALERDCLVYRAYVALGQHQARVWQPHAQAQRLAARKARTAQGPNARRLPAARSPPSWCAPTSRTQRPQPSRR